VGRLLVPHGTTTIIADPHEIANVSGLEGIKYVLEATKETPLDIKYLVPSCVPSTPFEHSGATIDAELMKSPLEYDNILGLGELMNYQGVIDCHEEVIDKIVTAMEKDKIIDGHAPMIKGNDLNAYSCVNILSDHECYTVEEMNDRISRGMYVALREGSACNNLRTLLKGLTDFNSRRCVLCSDDRQPKTIFEKGHMEDHLQICRNEGIDEITSLRMCTLNAAECYGLKDRGAISPGLRADIVMVEDLDKFNALKVFIKGEQVAECGIYMKDVTRSDASRVTNTFNVKYFSVDRLKMHLTNDKVNVIGITPGGINTKKLTEEVRINFAGEFVHDPKVDIVKVAVIERHKGTGNVATALMKGYGIKKGAIAISIAHDSHNIIVTGVTNEDMAFAVEELIRQNGGMIAVNNGKIIESMPLPIAGIMSDKYIEWVDEKLTAMHNAAINVLGVNDNIDPIMTLSFMSLPVIPEIKLTDMGLFDVTKFDMSKFFILCK
jgi:adenine deaminase